MSWLRRILGAGPSPAGAPGGHGGADADPFDDGAIAADALLDDEPFTCTTCGRTDLPEAGDWDPPICLECDAAINFDAIEAVEITEDC